MKTSILIVIVSVSFVANAQWSKIPSSDFQMAAPPREGSRAYTLDYETLQTFQDERTVEQCNQAKRQKWPTFSLLFNEPTILARTQYNKSKALMERVAKFTERVANYFKEQYERPRPYDVDENIVPCVPKVEGAKAYPSSHAAVASSLACILAEVYPNKAQEILAYGKELGDLRVVVGVHHPSDVKAGQKLGKDVCARLLTEDDFLEELEGIR